MANSKAVALAVGFMILLNLTGHCYSALEFGFYNGKCKLSDVEDIVRRTVYSKFLRDRTIAPALIRMQFHDCFVNVTTFVTVLHFYYIYISLVCEVLYIYMEPIKSNYLSNESQPLDLAETKS
ncbi:putative peroxidase [Helianthus anomalus]